MKTNITKIFLGLTFLAFLNMLVSCKNDAIENDMNVPKRLQVPHYDMEEWHSHGIPVADSLELLTYAGAAGYDSTGVLDYRLARDYAFVEFYTNIRNYCGDTPSEWFQRLMQEQAAGDSVTLRFADVPVVVYDYENKPYFYEFPVIYDGYIEGQVVATVTVAAQPRTKELIEFVFPDPLTYHPANFTYKRYVGEYPSVYLSQDGEEFFQLGLSSDISGIELQIVTDPCLIADPYESMMNKLQNLSSEEIADMNSDLEENTNEDQVDPAYSNVQNYINSFQVALETKEYWRDELLSYHPSTIFSITPLQSFINSRLNSISRDVKQYLPEYNRANLRLTRWSDFCGPGIMSWLYRGKYDTFNGKYLPLYGEGSVSPANYPCYGTYNYYSLYYMDWFEDYYPDAYNRRIINSEHTDGGLYATFFKHTTQIGNNFPLLDAGLRQSLPEATNGEYRIKFITTPISWMKSNEQPVVVEGIYGRPHYWGAIGYAYNEGWLGVKLNMRIFVMDNGCYSCSADHKFCYPYWAHLGGLNYAWRAN